MAENCVSKKGVQALHCTKRKSAAPFEVADCGSMKCDSSYSTINFLVAIVLPAITLT